MSRTEHPAIKDQDNEHPVASAWRATLCDIVSASVNGDYGLSQGIKNVDPVSAASVKQIKDYIDEYGETLIELPDESWKTSVAMWIDPYWDVLVDLWTEGEGASDLVLKARVRESDGGFRYEGEMVYVP